MKLSELIEKILDKTLTQGYELSSGGIYVNTDYRYVILAIIKAIKKNEILTLKSEYSYVNFIVKEEDFIDEDLLDKLDYKLNEYHHSNKNNQNTIVDYYMKRMCGIINVRVFRLVENDVF